MTSRLHHVDGQTPCKVPRIEVIDNSEVKETVSWPDHTLPYHSAMIPAVDVSGSPLPDQPTSTDPFTSSIFNITSPQDSVLSNVFEFIVSFPSPSKNTSFYVDFFSRYLNRDTFSSFLTVFHPIFSLSHHIDKLIYVLLQLPINSSSPLLFLLNSKSSDPILYHIVLMRLFHHVPNALFVIICKFWEIPLSTIAAYLSFHLNISDSCSLLSGFYSREEILIFFSEHIEWKNHVDSIFSLFMTENFSKNFRDWLFPPSLSENICSNYSQSVVTEYLTKYKMDLNELQHKYSPRCSSCKQGKHYYSSSGCALTATQQLQQLQGSETSIVNVTISVCHLCSMHHYVTRPKTNVIQINTELLTVGFFKPCLLLKHCNSCLLFGHINKECVFRKQSAINFKSFFSSSEAKAFYHQKLWVGKDEILDTTVIDDTTNESAFTRNSSVLLANLQLQNGNTPLLSIIARVLDVLTKQDYFYLLFDQSLDFSSLSSVTSNMVSEQYKDCFYITQSIEDGLWQCYSYIPPFMRLTYSLLYYTCLQQGPFYHHYCSHDSKESFSLLSDVKTIFERSLESTFQLVCVQTSLLSIDNITGADMHPLLETYPITTADFINAYSVYKGIQFPLLPSTVSEQTPLANLQKNLSSSYNNWQTYIGLVKQEDKWFIDSLLGRIAERCQSHLNNDLFIRRLYHMLQYFCNLSNTGLLNRANCTACLYLLDSEDKKFYIIEGGTGSGKSTLLPVVFSVLYFPLQVILVQSKRAAVVGIVNFILQRSSDGIKQENNPLVAPSYRNVDSSKYPSTKAVSLVIETTGMTFIRMINNGFTNVGVILVDEAHERTLIGDFCYWYLTYVSCFQSLKGGFISATVDKSLFIQYVDVGDDLFQLSIGTQHHNVTRFTSRPFPHPKNIIHNHDLTFSGFYQDFLPFLENHCSFSLEVNTKEYAEILYELICCFCYHYQSHHRNYRYERHVQFVVLVFVPDRDQCSSIVEYIEQDLQNDQYKRDLVVKLYAFNAGIAHSIQDEILTPLGSEFLIKIVVATTIAESSLTIPDVSLVLDSGLTNVPRLIKGEKVNMKKVLIAKFQQQQREGRTGRTCPGVYIPLYPFDQLQQEIVPELQQTEHAESVLLMLHLGEKLDLDSESIYENLISKFEFENDTTNALERLCHFNCIHHSLWTSRLTEFALFKLTLTFPLEVCRMLYCCINSPLYLTQSIVLSAVLTSKDIFQAISRKRTIDQLEKRSKLYSKFSTLSSQFYNDFITYIESVFVYYSSPTDNEGIVQCLSSRALKAVYSQIEDISRRVHRHLTQSIVITHEQSIKGSQQKLFSQPQHDFVQVMSFMLSPTIDSFNSTNDASTAAYIGIPHPNDYKSEDEYIYRSNVIINRFKNLPQFQESFIELGDDQHHFLLKVSKPKRAALLSLLTFDRTKKLHYVKGSQLGYIDPGYPITGKHLGDINPHSIALWCDHSSLSEHDVLFSIRNDTYNSKFYFIDSLNNYRFAVFWKIDIEGLKSYSRLNYEFSNLFDHQTGQIIAHGLNFTYTTSGAKKIGPFLVSGKVGWIKCVNTLRFILFMFLQVPPTNLELEQFIEILNATTCSDSFGTQQDSPLYTIDVNTIQHVTNRLSTNPYYAPYTNIDYSLKENHFCLQTKCKCCSPFNRYWSLYANHFILPHVDLDAQLSLDTSDFLSFSVQVTSTTQKIQDIVHMPFYSIYFLIVTDDCSTIFVPFRYANRYDFTRINSENILKLDGTDETLTVTVCYNFLYVSFKKHIYIYVFNDSELKFGLHQYFIIDNDIQSLAVPSNDGTHLIISFDNYLMLYAVEEQRTHTSQVSTQIISIIELCNYWLLCFNDTVLYCSATSSWGKTELTWRFEQMNCRIKGIKTVSHDIATKPFEQNHRVLITANSGIYEVKCSAKPTSICILSMNQLSQLCDHDDVSRIVFSCFVKPFVIAISTVNHLYIITTIPSIETVFSKIFDQQIIALQPVSSDNTKGVCVVCENGFISTIIL
ncbi:hypothetical protein RCL1_005923 [Eukaryota sp. TZLM3-RCL]